MADAADPGGGSQPPGPDNDTPGFYVAYEDLEGAANSTHGPVAELTWARSHLAGAKLASDAFGPSDQAAAIVKYWNDALDQRYYDIQTCISNIEGAGDRLQTTLHNYIAAEDQNEDAVTDTRKDVGGETNNAPTDPYHDDPGLLRPGAP